MISILPESFDDLLKCLSVFMLGGIIVWMTGQALRLKALATLPLYVWHTVFCFAYTLIAIRNGADAIGYYMRSFDMFLTFDFGTNSMVLVVSFLTQTLGLSFLACSLVFNIVGSLGLVLLLAAFREAQGDLHWTSWVFLLLPSVSFWSAGVGKDPLSFFASSLFAWWMITGGVRIWPLLVSLVVMAFARPHIAVVLGAAAMLFGLIQVRQSPVRAVVGVVLVFVGGIYLFPIVMQKMNLEEFNLDAIGEVVEGRESQNLLGGSSLDISSMPYYLKVFTYLFRPMPFDAGDAFQLMNSGENMILLVLILVMSGLYVNRKDKSLGRRLLPLLLMGIFLSVFLSLITANLGIAVRQKWMALVPLFVVLATALKASKPLPAFMRPARYFPGQQLPRQNGLNRLR